MKAVYVLVLAGLMLAACGAQPELQPKRPGNPEGVDLSGEWILRGAPPRLVEDEQTIRMPRANRNTPSGDRNAVRPSRSKGSAVHVFLESGSRLQVTQTDYGLFFSFDRAIVEEYNFGENRTVSVGPIEAQRVSGWEGRSFVIETMDDKGNVLYESWTLRDDPRVLVRDVRITEKGEPAWWSRQEFDRE